MKPGSSLAERGSSETKSVRVSELFADDTTLGGVNEKMEGGVQSVKELMDMFEERNNEAK